MAHILIAGMTLSGKSTLAKRRALAFKQNGIGVLVLDPISDPEWRADFITRNQEEFLRAYWLSQQCACFFDEGSRSVGKYNIATEETATLGRHRGHINHYIVQRVTQIPPIVRDQCTELFLFCSSHKDGVILSEEWNAPDLAECSRLRTGEYFHALKMGKCSQHSIFTEKRNGTNSDSRRNRSGSARVDDDDEERESAGSTAERTAESAGSTAEHAAESAGSTAESAGNAAD